MAETHLGLVDAAACGEDVLRGLLLARQNAHQTQAEATIAAGN